MIGLRVEEAAEACSGRIEGVDADAPITSVVHDSRDVGPGSLFFALPGAQQDGHAFAASALKAGAVAVVVREDAELPAGSYIRVADTLDAIGALASAVRARLKATTIAITGSSGKTSTKDLTAAACKTERVTVSATASYNTEVGVPNTIFAADEETEVLIVEIGSRGVGHISALMPIVRPDISVVVNVGPAHIGMFGTVEKTADAKAELVEPLGQHATAILNADDPLVDAMAARTRAQVVRFGRNRRADVRAEDITVDSDACASFTLVAGKERAPVALRTAGEHAVSNALAAAAAARAAGVSMTGIASGLSNARASAWRMEVRDVGGRRIINDAYNANPDSMAAGLKTLVAMSGERPSWAVLGFMAELGEEAAASHDRIGRLAVRLGVHHLVTVGEDARAIHEAARLEGMFGGEAVFVPTIDEAIALLRARLEPDAVVLVKASRAVGLERVALALGETA